ncbi:transferrin binding protein A (plasmid) [Aliivibrio wodanis]|uniref:Transferrin binding protein A n=1 Tax=Aliivibrio wodanis TaxID=80852 RepID=A0A090I8N5_9GAMM|nr:transferrin binding protein A [Aliivibrio wodanis]
MNKVSKLVLFPLSILTCNVYSSDITTFEEILVKANREPILNEANIEIGHQKIDNEMSGDINDLVKGELGVSVVQKGRAGTSGFNIRGVSEDRVAILVDGIQQGETFENEIYKGYGYFNGSINEIELDSVKSVAIKKGSDSLFTGSGSLGGSVSFKTKDATDIILPGSDYGFYNKTMYGSKNNELKNTTGLALKKKYGDLLVLYTDVNGHELETRDEGIDIYGKSRSRADPIDKKSFNLLVKSTLNLNKNNNVILTYEQFSTQKDIDEKSWVLFGSSHRIIDSSGDRSRYSLEWEYLSNNVYLDRLSTKIYDQKIDQTDNSYVYSFKDEKLSQHYDRSIKQDSFGIEQKATSKNYEILSIPMINNFMVGYKRKKLQNNNVDIIIFGGDSYVTENSIIEPVETDSFYIAGTHEMIVSESELISFGARYDFFKNDVTLNGKSISNHLYRKSLDAPEDTKFSGITLSAIYDNQLTDKINIKYKISNGFRAPNANELYFSYGDKIAANRIEPNKNLKQETGITNEIHFEYIENDWQFSLNPYYTKYHNFIDLKSETIKVPNPWSDYPGQPEFNDQNYMQYQNVDEAYIYGLDMRFDMNLSTFLDIYDDLKYEAGISYSKGKGSDGDYLMEVNPLEVMNNIIYTTYDYRIGFYSNFIDKKDPKETVRNGKQSKYTSDSVLLMDLVINYAMTNNIKINAGVFNLLDKKYKTWDSVRSIPEFGSTNMVDRDGVGLNRFTAPGINYKIGLEMNF